LSGERTWNVPEDGGQVGGHRRPDRLELCARVKEYPGVQMIPHPHHVLAATAGMASPNESLCPMLDYLIKPRVASQHCQTRRLAAEAGRFAMAEETGMGPSLDQARLERM
jgi:hypothetical protein